MLSLDYDDIKDLIKQTIESLGGRAPSDAVLEFGWKTALIDLNAQAVAAALKEWIKTSSFVPKPADIRQLVIKNNYDQEERNQEARKAYKTPMPEVPSNTEFLRRLHLCFDYDKQHQPPRDWHIKKLLRIWLDGEPLSAGQLSFLVSVNALRKTEDDSFMLTGQYQPAKFRSWEEESGCVELQKKLQIYDHLHNIGNPLFWDNGKPIFPRNHPCNENN